jgi:S1-C subfamily serine protease
VSSNSDEERPVIGVNTSSSSKRDTIGLLIVGVTAGGPAERAGIEEGNRIVEVNGTSLRLSAADAGENDMQGLTTRRLVRELRKVEAGDEVTLRIYADGQTKTVKVKTIAAEDLPTARSVSRDDDEDRPVIGVSLNPSGSRRDTLGVLITHVTTDGPAEKAGLIEGDRIASINGVDLRVPGSEAGEGAISNAKSNRFRRELRKLKAGDQVELRVWSAGQYKTVRIKTEAAEDVYEEGRGWSFFFGNNEGGPMIPGVDGNVMQMIVPQDGEGVRIRTPVAPQPPVQLRRIPAPGMQLQREEAPRARPQPALTSASYMTSASPQVGGSFARSAAQVPPQQKLAAGFNEPIDPIEPIAPGFLMAIGSGQHYVLELPGMRLAKVGADLADYLGTGAERGLLVLEIEDMWAPLKIGDVILAVNGRAVRSGDAAAVALDTKGENTIDVIRRGQKITVRVDCR